MGVAVASACLKAGHVIGVATTRSERELRSHLGRDRDCLTVGSIPVVIDGADVIVAAIPWQRRTILLDYTEQLSRRVLLDAMNAFHTYPVAIRLTRNNIKPNARE